MTTVEEFQQSVQSPSSFWLSTSKCINVKKHLRPGKESPEKIRRNNPISHRAGNSSCSHGPEC